MPEASAFENAMDPGLFLAPFPQQETRLEEDPTMLPQCFRLTQGESDQRKPKVRQFTFSQGQLEIIKV
jgi:hypothetical protein